MTTHVALTADAHARTRLRPERSAAAGDALMSCIVVPDEFRRVQHEYLILFRRDLADGAVHALALLGFENGENLYLRDDGGWDARYVPLSMDIRPFLLGPPASTGEGRQVHLDAANPRLDEEEGTRLFDDGGRPTPFMEATLEKLGALDAGYQESAGFFQALERHALLEPLTLEITLDDGSVNRLVGFHVVDEDRLCALDGSALGALHRDGHLLPIFMALASQSNLPALIARKNARSG